MNAKKKEIFKYKGIEGEELEFLQETVQKLIESIEKRKEVKKTKPNKKKRKNYKAKSPEKEEQYELPFTF
jgi:hypothetical protein